MKMRPLGIIGSVSLLLSCHMPSPAPISPPTVTVQTQPENVAVAPRVTYTPKSIPFGQITALGNQKWAFQISYSARQSGFRTQAFDCGEVAFARLEVSGPGLAAPIYADGSDGQQMFATSGCEITGTLSQVPYGKIIVRLSLYDANRELLNGATLTAGLVFDATTSSLEMSFRQSGVGQVLETLINGSFEDEFLSQQLDLPELQTFFDTLTGVSGTAPDYSFTTHPALVDIERVVADLKDNGGQVSTLNPADAAYLNAPGQARLDLQGVLMNQDVTVSVDDALSTDATVSSNGEVIISNLPPGDWTLRLSGPGYLPQNIPLTVRDNQTTDLGTRTLLTPVPTLSSLSPTQGVSGQSITLTGTGFNLIPANHTVTFGNTPATVTAATATSLTVTVPTLTAGTQAVRVRVGAGNLSNSLNFEAVTPSLTSVVPTQQSIGQSVVLTGTHFNPTAGNNAVTIGGVAATVTAASATSLTVTVPPGVHGSVQVRVKNLQSPQSNSQNLGIVPTLTSMSLTSGSTGDSVVITGTGFEPSPATQTTVRFGTTVATLSATSATSLTVSVPEAAAGSAPVTVQVGSHTSSPASAFTLLPRLTALSTGQSFQSKPALIREETLTLTGSNFDLTPANNVVNFGGGITAAASSATATQLTVTVPGSLGTPGDVNVSVTSNGQSSNTLVGIVPAVSLNFTGGFQ
ncbi:MAG: IPT/TIG domain-containing protein [Candidatus Sericytochromatia bacterium]